MKTLLISQIYIYGTNHSDSNALGFIIFEGPKGIKYLKLCEICVSLEPPKDIKYLEICENCVCS